MRHQYNILCLEPRGKVTKYKSNSSDLQAKYGLDRDIVARLLRGEMLTILHTSYAHFPIGSKVSLAKMTSLSLKIKNLFTTKVNHLFTR